MKIVILISAFIFGTVSGVLLCMYIPSFMRNNIKETIEDLDEANQFLEKTVPQIDLMSATESVKLAMSGIELLQSQKIEKIESLLVEEVSRFYYNYAYENEREINDYIINDILDKIEEKAKTDELYKKIINYRPTEI